MAEFVQGPRPAGYNAEPVPRVTGEDLNGRKGGDSGCRYGLSSGGGRPCHRGVNSVA